MTASLRPRLTHTPLSPKRNGVGAAPVTAAMTLSAAQAAIGSAVLHAIATGAPTDAAGTAASPGAPQPAGAGHAQGRREQHAPETIDREVGGRRQRRRREAGAQHRRGHRDPRAVDLDGVRRDRGDTLPFEHLDGSPRQGRARVRHRRRAERAVAERAGG
jgi:hypothetical protein